jgi:hypothetical protein
MFRKLITVFAVAGLLGFAGHKAFSAGRCGSVCPTHHTQCTQDAGHLNNLHVCPSFHVF